MGRSKYLGVYTNKYKPTCKEYPYRVSLKRYTDSTPIYTDIGLFKTEETAANIYNIYALHSFGKGAIINDLPLSQETREEMQAFFDSVAHSDELLTQAMKTLKEHGGEIKINHHT